MKPPATQAAREVRAKLQALIARGIGHEIEGEHAGAVRKLARLEARYDWSAPCEQHKGDIFAGLNFCARSRTAQHLTSFGPGETDLAPFVQWAIEHAAGVRASIRNGPDWSVSVWAEVDGRAVAQLATVASTIKTAFADLWARYLAAGAQANVRRVFLLGCYDGMMDDGRRDGQRLPPIPAPPVKASRAKRKLAVAPGVAIHPYEIALPLGRQVRFSVPHVEIVESLSERLSGKSLPAHVETLAA